MDSLTHIALGACMGEAFAGKTVGRKAMLWGALAQSIPDIDFVAVGFMDTAGNLLAHRGFTHSFLFCALITPLMALLAERWHRPHNISLQRWMLFFGAVIFVHILLDAFNNYGVGWLEPFSHKRISFNAIYVADPFFSIWPGIAFIALLFLKKRNNRRRFWWRFGLGFASIYLVYCLVNKTVVNRNVEAMLQSQQVQYTRYFSTPAPLQNWLWYVVAGTDSGYYVGYHSIFDRNKKLALQYFPVNDSLLHPFRGNEDLARLERFSQHYYTVEQWSDTTVFNDLRFGQIIGWKEPKEKFAFHYFLQAGLDNKLVVQRGRFAKWDWDATQALINRIRGN